jgi:hypothetical protein
MVLLWVWHVVIDWELDLFPDKGTVDCHKIPMGVTIATVHRAVERSLDIGFHKPCKPHTIESHNS